MEVSAANPLPVSMGGSVALGASDAQIGAVEIKDGTTDTRAAVDATYGVAVDIKRMPGIQAATGSLTNRSGTITAGGTSQVLMAANATRKYLFIQNVSVNDLWIDFGTAAIANQPSIKLVANAVYIQENSFVSTQAVNIIGATTAQAYTAKEG
ncbi:hypothetical protein D3C71_1035420 [compost metagenome]